MNTIATALLLCILQVTLLSFLAAGVYALLRRFGPRAGASVLITSLALVAVLTLLAFSPWPRWTLRAGLTNTVEAPAISADNAHVGPTAASTSGETPVGAVADDIAMGTDAQQPSAGLFFENLLKQLSQAPVERDAPGLRWPHVVIVLMLLGLIAGLVRLAAGFVAVRSYRRQGRRIDDPRLNELVDLLQAESGCRRRPEMRESDALTSAATVGWRRPVVLLPSAWRQWTGDQLRVVLAHEFGHICSNDFLAGFLGQIVLALHFYHPLVHWLMARLRLEQELAADSLAAGLSGGRRVYLTILAEMALHKADQNVGWPARAFLPAKTTFLRRIAMLRNTRFRVTPVARGVRAAAVAVTLLVGLFIAGLRPPASQQTLAADPSEEGGSASPSLSEIDLSYVPSDALIVMAARPSVIMERMEKIGLGELAREATQPGGSNALPLRGIAMQDTEQIISVTWKYKPVSRQYPQLSRKPVKLHIVRSHEPNDFEEMIRIELPDAKEKSYQGQSYFVSPGLYAGAEICCFRPDDRTIVVLRDKEPGIGQLIEAGPGEGPAILTEEGKTMVASDLGFVLIDASRLHDHAQDEAGRGHYAGEFSFLTSTVMLPNVTSVVVGLNLEDRFDARALFTCKTEVVATKVKDGLGALQVLNRNFVETKLPDTPYLNALRPGFLALLDSLETKWDGLTVRAGIAGPIGDNWPERHGELILAAMNQTKRDLTSNNLKQHALAMHMYHDKNKRFPPAVLYGPDGKTPYSWRVAILPFVGERELYKEYRFDEPWDGPNNRKLLERMPRFYRHPKAPDSTNASYFALTGPGTVFEGEEGCGFVDISDGTSNVLLFVEAKRNIPWTKPEDIPYDPAKPIPELGGLFDGSFGVALCDGSVHALPNDVPEKALRTFISRADRIPTRIHDHFLPGF